MYVKLMLHEKLKDERTKRNMTLADLEKATGISKASLSKYESDTYTDISPFNLVKLAEYYGLSLDYLMGLRENKYPQNISLDHLHLDDATIDLLKSGTLNNRLLCELLCHPAFPQLLIDMEVCIDQIADMRVKDMNLTFEIARKLALKRHGHQQELDLRTLELAQVSEDLFFAHVLHNDLDQIVKDLRTRHETDLTTADSETPAFRLLKKIPLISLDVLAHKSSIDEKRALTVCKLFHIDYDKLSEEDRSTLIRILKKSPLLPTSGSQRGKSKRLSLFPQKKEKKS